MFNPNLHPSPYFRSQVLYMPPSVQTLEEISSHDSMQELKCYFLPNTKSSLCAGTNPACVLGVSVDGRSCNTSDGCMNFQSSLSSWRSLILRQWDDLKPFTTDFGFQNQRITHQVIKINTIDNVTQLVALPLVPDFLLVLSFRFGGRPSISKSSLNFLPKNTMFSNF